MASSALGADFLQRVRASTAVLRTQKQHTRVYPSFQTIQLSASSKAAPPVVLEPVAHPAGRIQPSRDQQQPWQQPEDDVFCREINALLVAQVSIPGILAIVESHLDSFNAVNVATAFQRIAKVCLVSCLHTC